MRSTFEFWFCQDYALSWIGHLASLGLNFIYLFCDIMTFSQASPSLPHTTFAITQPLLYDMTLSSLPSFLIFFIHPLPSPSTLKGRFSIRLICYRTFPPHFLGNFNGFCGGNYLPWGQEFQILALVTNSFLRTRSLFLIAC